MAGIYIPGMEMPTNADGCEVIIRIQPDGVVLDAGRIHLGIKAIPVPDHGNLKDADLARDAMINKWIDSAVNSFEYKRGMEDACEVIRNIPTIIPADRKEGKA